MNITKTNLSTFAVFALLASLFASSCQSPKKMQAAIEKVKFKAEPEVLEVRGDSITVKITGKIPPKTFAKKATVKFQPVLRYGAEEKPLPPMYLVGEKVKGVKDATVVKYKTGRTFTYEKKVEYTPEMRKSSLTLDYTVKFNSQYEELNQCVSGTKDSAVKGTITTALTVKPTDDLYYYSNDMPMGGTRRVIFYYVINEGKFRDSVFRGPAIKSLESVAADSTFKFTSITLRSFASPDGEMKRNVELTHERAESGYNLVKDVLKRNKVAAIKDDDIFKKPDEAGEDWAGLKMMVSNSGMAGKDEIMNVINSNMSPEDKETALRKLSSWDDLKVNILPRLRRTEVYMAGTFPNRKIEDVTTMVKANNYDALTKKEVIMYANKTDDLAAKESAYKYLMNKYPEDWAGINNYGTVLIKEGNYKMADSMLTMAHNKYPNNDTIASNLGVAKRLERKYDEAKNLYAQGGKSVSEKNNMGILYIKYGDYDNAVNSFEPNRCDYNTALAYVLKGDEDAALQKIDCIQDKTADVYYLRAVAAARKGDTDLMTTSLTLAIQKDPTYRDQAKTDLEFRKYWNKAEFLNAIK
jgi:tetratricopeptide (TPR) repeat protein